MATLPADSRLFQDVDYVFHFGGIGDIVPSIERPAGLHAGQHQRHPGGAGGGAAGRGPEVRLRRVVVLLRAATGCRPRERRADPTRVPLRVQQVLGESAALHWGKVYGLPVTSIRMFNVYGPRVRTTGVYGAVFGVFLAQKLHGKPLTVVGDGTQRRDFVYVTDVARLSAGGRVRP